MSGTSFNPFDLLFEVQLEPSDQVLRKRERSNGAQLNLLFICVLAATLGIRKIRSLEPAIVFRG
jgi:hypothetical protein